MESLQIDAANIDDVVRYLCSKEQPFFRPTAISLPAAMELAFWVKSQPDGLTSTIQLWQREHVYLKQCVAISEGETLFAPQETYAVLPHEFFAIRADNDVLRDEWNFFLERFSRALRESGFKHLSQGIAGGFSEIATNVVQHSTFGKKNAKMNGIAAYAVSAKSVSFAVGDDGIGALQSLRTNPRWSSLGSHREAVRAIGHDHASRRVDQGEGQGYRELFDALASFDGTVRLRSGDGVFTITGTIDTATAIGANVPHIPGLQISVHCTLK